MHPDLPPPGTLQAGGLRWRLQRAGPPGAPGLLLLHGTGSSGQSWAGCLPGLVSQFELVVPDLPGHGGTAFYAFGDTAEVEALKHDFRAGLDALPIAPHQADAFVAEACEAFRWHQRMFEELQG